MHTSTCYGTSSWHDGIDMNAGMEDEWMESSDGMDRRVGGSLTRVDEVDGWMRGSLY